MDVFQLRPPLLQLDISDLNGMMPCLQAIDADLEQALKHHSSSGSVSEDEPQDLRSGHLPETPLSTPNDHLTATTTVTVPLRPESAFGWLQTTFGLSWFDLKVLTLALVPELDRRYEKLCAYLLEDSQRQRPTVDLALTVLCPTAISRLEHRHQFAPTAPLIRHQLICLKPSQGNASTWLTHELHVDEPIVQFLLGQAGVPPSLGPYCDWEVPVSPDSTDLLGADWENLSTLVSKAWQHHDPLRICLHGPDDHQQREWIRGVAHALHVPIMRADIRALVRGQELFKERLQQIVRAAWLQSSVLCLEQMEHLGQGDGHHLWGSAWEILATFPGILFLPSSKDLPPPGAEIALMSVSLPPLNHNQRITHWQHQLQRWVVEMPQAEVEYLSDRFQLTPSQIASSVELAYRTAQAKGQAPTEQDLAAAARSQSSHALNTYALKVAPKYHWADIILPANTKAQLREICNQAKHREQVQETWGFNRKLSLGQGLTVLFSGPPGTGKTMAAEVIAQALSLDLYKIDLSQVVSKYIGETEKSLSRIFDAATNANAVLLFDEADALFGKRTEVQDAHDRYANIETSYLLQKMEEYAGIAILTTNLRNNMDEAFVRRLRFIVEFPMPEVAERQQIWQHIWPEDLPLADDVDVVFLAERLEIPGAVIRNIALRAAYLAAEADSEVGMAQLIPAIRREYQKMGKILMKADLKEFGELH